MSKTKNVACISGPAVVGVKEEHRAESMTAQQGLHLGSILSMGLRRNPSVRHVNGDDYPLNMCKLCQGTLQKSKNSTEPDSRRAAPTSMCAAVNRIGTCHVITLSLGLKYQ